MASPVTLRSFAQAARILGFTAGAGGIETLAADPGTPTEGQMWYNTTDDVLRVFDGTSIQQVTTENEITSLFSLIDMMQPLGQTTNIEFIKFDETDIPASSSADVTVGGELYRPTIPGPNNETTVVLIFVPGKTGHGMSLWYAQYTQSTASSQVIGVAQIYGSPGQPFTISMPQVNVPPKQVKYEVANAAASLRTFNAYGFAVTMQE